MFLAAVALLAAAVSAEAAEKASSKAPKTSSEAPEGSKLKNHFKFYGFIRNYFAYDNRECEAGTGDLFMWYPKDQSLNALGEDMNRQDSFRFLTITSRVGVDVSGYTWGKTQFGAKVEADFYAGLTNGGGYAQLRLRQAYATVKWDNLGAGGKGWISGKMGQAWHPMAADLPDIFSLDSGSPFNAFTRPPQVTFDFGLDQNWYLSAAAIWQMQYKSMGPDGAQATYQKYALVPEFYLAANFKKGGFLGRVGVDILTIKPRHTASVDVEVEGETVTTTRNVGDCLTAFSPYIYLQYTKGKFAVKGKSILGSAAEHMNLMSGYAVCDMSDEYNYQYTPIRTTTSWVSIAYGKKLKGALLLAYQKNLGASKDVVCTDAGYADKNYIYFQKSAYNIAQMGRIQPEVTYNIGKFTLGLEYMLTAAQWGDAAKLSSRAIPTENLHWVVDHRIQGMIKFTF